MMPTPTLRGGALLRHHRVPADQGNKASADVSVVKGFCRKHFFVLCWQRLSDIPADVLQAVEIAYFEDAVEAMVLCPVRYKRLLPFLA